MSWWKLVYILYTTVTWIVLSYETSVFDFNYQTLTLVYKKKYHKILSGTDSSYLLIILLLQSYRTDYVKYAKPSVEQSYQYLVWHNTTNHKCIYI